MTSQTQNNDSNPENSRPSSFWPVLIGMVMLALIVFQFRSIASLRSEIEALRAESSENSQSESPAKKVSLKPDQRTRRAGAPVAVGNSAELESRVVVLEERVAALKENANHLMDRGQVPPDAVKAAEWKARFLDPNTSARDMFSTLRLLRRNELFDDEIAAHAANLLAQSTNTTTIRAMLDTLRGLDNPALKPAFLALARDSDDRSVRSRAVYNLREFAANDPKVEATLWKIAKEDGSREVRSRAEDALKRIPMTDARQATLTQQVANIGLPFEERWTAFRILGAGRDVDISQLALSLAQSSQSAPDNESKLAYIRAFDDVNHDEFMVPLVASVQDSDPEVRLRATDALVDYRDRDPNVLAWLRVLAESDPDPRVRREAARAFQTQSRRRTR